MVRFYTTPPPGVDYPYFFTTMVKDKWRLLFRYRWRHAIVDAGVEYWFHRMKVRDYPERWLKWYVNKAKQLSRIFNDRVWIVIPDYPDDYTPCMTYEDDMDNVDKTLRNIEEFISIDGVAWLPVIQSRFENTFSFIESCHRLRKLIGSYPRVAIGTVCKARKLAWIEYCLKYARSVFSNSWIHAFGLTLSALERVKTANSSFDSTAWDTRRRLWLDSFDSMAWSYDKLREYDRRKRSWRTRAVIDSFDSMAYTFPRYRGRPSAKSVDARLRYFNAYLQRIGEILGDELEL